MKKASKALKKNLTDFWEEFFEPRPTFDLVDWLEDNIYLPREVSPVKEGKLDLSYSPHVRWMLKDYLDDDIEFVVAMLASQTGKTLYIMLCKILQVKFDPAPAMAVYPNASLCSRLIEKRLKPLIEANECLKSELRDCRDPITNTRILFNRMDSYFAGAGSPTNISSDTIKYMDIDECAKIRSYNVDEKDAVGNAIVRTKLLERKGRKVNITSTPNIAGDEISTRYKNAESHRKWMIKCPSTKKWFVPEWACIKWEGDTKKEWVESVHITSPFDEKVKIKTPQKNELLREGKPTERPLGALSVGWHVPSWCSQFVSLEYVAEQWWDAQGDILKNSNIQKQ